MVLCMLGFGDDLDDSDLFNSNVLEGKAPELPGPGVNVEEEDGSSSSDSSGAPTSDESEIDEPAAKVKRFRARIPEGQAWFVHSKSHLVHRLDGDDLEGIRFTVCGKRLTDMYEPCTEATAWNILCKSCNRK